MQKEKGKGEGGEIEESKTNHSINFYPLQWPKHDKTILH